MNGNTSRTIPPGLAVFAALAALTAAGCGNDAAPTTSTDATNPTTATTGSDITPSPAATAMATGHHHEDTTTGGVGDGAMDHAMGTAGLDALRRAEGRAFDVAFLSQMIAHHEAAVTMAEQALKAPDADDALKTAARRVIDAQRAEIAQMTSWLKAWYGVAPSPEQQALVRRDMAGMMAMPVNTRRMFYEMMIPHHQGAIDMSELAPERSARPEVKRLAAQILRDQRAEIADYRRALGPGGAASNGDGTENTTHDAGHAGHSGHTGH